MNQYICFFSVFVGDVSEFVVVDADSDATACVKADEILKGQPNYASVEIFVNDRTLGRIERAA
jgi:hypothetical protein